MFNLWFCSFVVAIHLPFLNSNPNDIEALEFPIYEDKFNCDISYITAAHELYVHSKRDEDIIRKLLDDMYESTQNGKHAERINIYFPIQKSVV